MLKKTHPVKKNLLPKTNKLHQEMNFIRFPKKYLNSHKKISLNFLRSFFNEKNK